MYAIKKIIRFIGKYFVMLRRSRRTVGVDHDSPICEPTLNKVSIMCFYILMVLVINIILIVTFQKDIIASVRAVGVQCQTYDIDVHEFKNEIEDIKQ